MLIQGEYLSGFTVSLHLSARMEKHNGKFQGNLSFEQDSEL
jgi:hypothetical protein